MRELTKKQKTLLDNYIKSVDKTESCHLHMDLYKELEKINDTEILWQEAQRYLIDNCNKFN